MPVKILMVENDPDDRLLTKEAFEKEWPQAEINFLYGADLNGWLTLSGYRPQIILLAMNTHPDNATEMIRQLRTAKGYEGIPIIVLSETTLPKEIRAAYLAGASSFITKPANYTDTMFKIKSFINYWFQTVELPLFSPE